MFEEGIYLILFTILVQFAHNLHLKSYFFSSQNCCIASTTAPDFKALKRYLEKAIPLYNNVMPHGTLGGIPPVDVLNGESIDNYNVKEKLEVAKKLRIIENRKANCGICE